MTTLEDVFVTDAFPRYTYVAAEEGRVETELNEGLAIANKIISIVGPSKCGKTTLCDKVFGTERGEHKLFATGDSFDTIDEFWDQIFRQCPGSEVYDAGEKVPRNTIVDFILECEIPVVIDDFHYIEGDIQRRLCQQMKNCAARGVRFIVLNTPHRGDDPVRNNPDLSGRFFSIDVNFWDESSLIDIGNKGFTELGIDLARAVLERLARESLGSPQLMQTLCLELGREYLDLDRPYENQTISEDVFSWQSVRSRAVRSYDHTTLYEMLSNGPPRRGQARIIYDLVNSRTGDVYDVIAHALAVDPPFASIDLEQLRERASKVLSDTKTPNYSAALEQLNGLFNRSHQPIQFDAERRRISMVDPHFYFFLRTKSADAMRNG